MTSDESGAAAGPDVEAIRRKSVRRRQVVAALLMAAAAAAFWGASRLTWATGSAEEVQAYRKVFGVEGVKGAPVTV